MDEPKLYEYAYGSILVECEGTLEYPHAELLGFTVAEEALTVNGVKMPLEELYKANTEKFAAVYPDKGRNSAEVMTSAPAPKTFVYPGEAVETPVVYIPVFPGTNCDYDTAKAFRAAGGRGPNERLVQHRRRRRSTLDRRNEGAYPPGAHLRARRRFLGGRRTRRKRQIHCQCVEQ